MANPGTSNGAPKRTRSGALGWSLAALLGRVRGAGIFGARGSIIPPGESSSRAGLAAVAALLVLFFSLRHDNFFTADNATTIAVSMSAILIAVVGTSMLLVARHVDLSIGSAYALIGMIVGEVAVSTGSTPAAVVVGLVSGLAIGLINGTLVQLLRISPLIVTIGLLAVYRGLAFVVSDVSVYGFPESFVEIGRGEVASIPYFVLIALVVFMAGAFVLTRTVTGLRMYAIGGDPRAAARAGVRVSRVVTGLYGVNGMLIGLVAVLTTARLGSAQPSLADGFEFDVLTAAILGGVAFTGGAGRPVGIFIGVAAIGIINAGLIFEGLADFWQRVAKGSILVLALAADQLAARRRERRAVRQGGAAESQDEEVEAPPDAGDLRVEHEVDDWQRGRELLRLEEATKGYGAVRALEHVDLVVHEGEVVCLLGDNGAGKSTLANIVAGAERADFGDLRLGGQVVHFRGPADARAAGIETVYQTLALCPNLSVPHNLVLGDEPTKRLLGLIRVRDDRRATELAVTRLAELGIHLQDERALVQSLSGGQRQSVAIARALGRDVRLILLDEPTAALGVSQSANVLQLVKSIAAQGTGVLMITHDVQSVLEVADRVVVLRFGRVIYDGPVQELSEHQLLRLMAGLDHGVEEAADGPVVVGRG